MALTLTVAQTHLEEWLAADSAVSVGQSYSIQGRSLTRTDAGTIREQITYWQRVVDSLTAKAAGSKNPGVALARWT